MRTYSREIFLGGTLRGTLRSESENNCFKVFTNCHVSLVEYWLRFESAMDAERYEHSESSELLKLSMPELKTLTTLKMHASKIYTHINFSIFQEVVFSCGINSMSNNGEFENFSDFDSKQGKSFDIVYQVANSTHNARCFYKMFQNKGILLSDRNSKSCN